MRRGEASSSLRWSSTTRSAGRRPLEGEGPGVVARTPRQIFGAKFKQDKLAITGACLVLLMILLALSASLFEKITDIKYDHQFRDVGLNEFGSPSPPDSTHWFGFDDLSPT